MNSLDAGAGPAMNTEEGGARPVVVGVDGSDSSLAAVRFATREAAWRQLPLRIVHAFIWPLMHVKMGPSEAGPQEGGLRHDAERTLATAAAVAREADPSVSVLTDLVTGAPSPVLLRAARDAELLVIGDRGLGGFTGLLVGSVAVQCTAHGRTPVLVVRGERRDAGPVVVGVDGSPDSVRTIEAAFEEAAMRDTEVLAVHSWSRAGGHAHGEHHDHKHDAATVALEEGHLLEDALAGVRKDYPDVKVREHLLRGRPAKVLVELSKQAQLVVVGAHGRGGFTGLLLGSVSHQVLHHADSPVLVIPRTEGRAPS
ncbi:universal stress protein [Catellatospora sp. IY07-71]|uniref:universal stress protein n=1 Tax=Catellatospora sp. IY07-71 TaxID=2728827 RepID=UPI001BB7E779|nr:universal stress protein [Catellatospora sp. IY07-71]BCJ75489.1 universal stress protein [Catellatospora sp. IY07-71]